MGTVNISKLHHLTGHNDCVYTLEQSQYPHIFFSGAGDGMVVSWDLNDPENGVLIAKLPNSIYGLHYAHQQELLLVGHNYDGIHFIDWQSKKEVGSLNMTKSAIFDIKTANGLAYIGDASGVITVVDIMSLTIVNKVEASSESVRTLAINVPGDEIAAGYSDNKIRVFNRSDLTLKYTLTSHENSVFTLRYSPDYQLLLSAGRDAHLKIWDVKADYLLLQDIVAHMFAINNIDYSPEGKHFVTCSMDKSIKVWDATTFKLLKVIDKARHAGHGTSVNKLLWSSHDALLISASDDRTISVWDVEVGQ
ncbi:WD40 repeat domain-containing protein [Fulvivirga sp. M361]|uniref:WD40 repeat domain-containing protein n=1 Tax=Fulvivirga sp. M361 TaxID=2594266 RepID=UPI00117B2FAE|nr:WD40 repeat domain-containing protein [Fulvivirga sp. M361]TRX53796.1 WD40 repeat domain-containing protein [Fulvivirga sp. M361]